MASLPPPTETPTTTLRVCSVCLENIPPERMICLECGHSPACTECLVHWFHTEIQNRKTALSCTDCFAPVSREMIEAILPAELFAKYELLEVEQLVEKEWVIFHCPGCRAIMSADNDQIRRVTCPACKKHFCFQCKVEWHENTTCAKYQEWARENGNADILTWDLVNRLDVKRCPKCHAWIEKNQGCDHMRCTQCRYDFWWSTLEPYRQEPYVPRGRVGRNDGWGGDVSRDTIYIPPPPLPPVKYIPIARPPLTYLGPASTFGQASAALLKFRKDRQIDSEAEAKTVMKTRANAAQSSAQGESSSLQPSCSEEKKDDSTAHSSSAGPAGIPRLSESQLRLLTGNQLKEICTAYGLPKYSKKERLVEAILKYQANHM